MPALLAGLVVALGAPALAQTAPGPPPTPTTTAPAGPTIELAAQDPWTPLGGDVALRLAIANPPPGATVSFSASQPFTSKKAYDSAMLGGPFGSVVSQVSIPVDELPVDELGTRPVKLGLQSLTGTRDLTRLNLRRAGVYQVKVDLRDADEADLATFRTALVVTEADKLTVAEPLQVAWVWPLSAAPSYRPDGGPDRDVVAGFRGDGRLGAMAVALRLVPDVPITLAPTAETMEAWAELAKTDPAIQGTNDAIRNAAATRPVLQGTYVPVDLASLLDHGLATAADEEILRGSEVLQSAVGSTLDTRTRVLHPASASALARLHSAGVDRVIVDSTDVVLQPETRLTLAQPVTLSASTAGGTEAMSALVTDSGLQGLLTADLPPAQRMQLLLGGLSVIAQEAPTQSRVVALVNPDDFDAPAELYEDLLNGLRNNPYLRPVTAAEAFDTVGVDPPAPTVTGTPSTERQLAAVSTAEPAVSAEAYRNQRTRLNSFGALTRPGDPAVTAADKSLLASVSNAWAPDIGKVRADAHLRVVDHAIDGLVSQIEVPDPRTITLTSRSGEIPLTFRNETGFPVRLRASLASEKLFFPDGSVIDLELPPKSTTVRVAVEARTSGTFPLDLEVTSTDGVLSISQRRLEVRSTFVSTVGVVLMGSAVAFLALWWGLDLRRRRRRRRQSPAT
ncbi:MAG: DUF6049 family protein [Acidimicrobiia bacterium]